MLVRPTGRPANGPATQAEPAELGSAQDSARLPILHFGEGLATGTAGYGQDGPCDSRIPAQRGPARQPTAYTADTRPEFAALVDHYGVEGTILTFVSSKGVTGRVEATPGLLVVDLTLSGLAVFAKTLIESKLEEALALIA